MAALWPAIHTPWSRSECVDGRDRPGHDGIGGSTQSGTFLTAPASSAKPFAASVHLSKEAVMRKIPYLGALMVAGLVLSGCGVVSVGSAVVGGAVSVASTTVHVTGDVVKGAADIATGQSDDDKKKDDKKKSD